jgi:hypothetical protein
MKLGQIVLIILIIISIFGMIYSLVGISNDTTLLPFHATKSTMVINGPDVRLGDFTFLISFMLFFPSACAAVWNLKPPHNGNRSKSK